MIDRFRISKQWMLRIAERGLSLEMLQRKAGLPELFFQQEKIYASTAELFSLWSTISDHCGDVAFGLTLGADMRLERNHPMAIAAVCSSCLRDALQRLARYKRVVCPEEIRVEVNGDEVIIDSHYLATSEQPPHIMTDMGFSWMTAMARHSSDGHIRPLHIELTRGPEHRVLLEGHFGCPITFNASRNALVFRSSDLDFPFYTHNEELLAVIAPQLDAELQEHDQNTRITYAVKQVLKRTLAGRRPTLQSLAKELAMSTRTLQRRLTDEGITFQQLVEETRRELARSYLQTGAIEPNETAYLLGYEDSNSFYRAFNGWEGVSPGEWLELQRRVARGAVVYGSGRGAFEA